MSARVIYSMSVSLDGYINSPSGSLDWADVDAEIHAWFNDRARNASAFIYGRRLYETMAAYWPRAESDPNATQETLDFARIWNPKPKVVFSRSLASVDWNSRLMRADSVAELTRLVEQLDGEVEVGGANLAAQFIEGGLVDQFDLVVHPVRLGGGTPFFPPGGRLDLQLTETQRFANGAVHLGYVTR